MYMLVISRRNMWRACSLAKAPLALSHLGLLPAGRAWTTYTRSFSRQDRGLPGQRLLGPSPRPPLLGQRPGQSLVQRPVQGLGQSPLRPVATDPWTTLLPSHQPTRSMSTAPPHDTIYALSTAPGKAGIAVIRISGPLCRAIYAALCPRQPFPRPRFASLRTLFHPLGDHRTADSADTGNTGKIKEVEDTSSTPSSPTQTAQSSTQTTQTPASDRVILDASALVLFFPGPKSVTGEDVLELHVHGGRATVQAVLDAIPHAHTHTTNPCTDTKTHTHPDPHPYTATTTTTSHVIRYAAPGEFTRRAFYHDRVDLAEVEALSDTLAAETEQQRRVAVRGTFASLGRRYEAWRRQLLEAQAELEALIDFSEDQHFDESPGELVSDVVVLVRDLLRQIRAYEAASHKNELVRNGIRIALLGPANAGKSSLMNLIVGREASIVSAEAGTTRDIVEASLDMGGYLCSFADTAGFRSVDHRLDSYAGDLGSNRDNHNTGDGHPNNRHAEPGYSVSAFKPVSAIGSIEREGIRRARAKAEEADVVLVLVAISVDARGRASLVYDAETLRLARRAQASMILVNKRDLVTDDVLARLLKGLRQTVASLWGETSDPQTPRGSWENESLSSDTITVQSQSSSSEKSSPGSLGSPGTLPIPPPIFTISCSEASLDQVHDPNSTLPRPSTSTSSSTSAENDPGSLHSVIQYLANTLFASLTSLPPDQQHLVGVTVRQRQLLADCHTHLLDALRLCHHDSQDPHDSQHSQGPHDPQDRSDGEVDLVLVAEHIRMAAVTLSQITGRGDAVDVEAILGVIFEK